MATRLLWCLLIQLVRLVLAYCLQCPESLVLMVSLMQKQAFLSSSDSPQFALLSHPQPPPHPSLPSECGGVQASCVSVWQSQLQGQLLASGWWASLLECECSLLDHTVSKCQIEVPDMSARHECQIQVPDTSARYKYQIQVPDTSARYECQIQVPDTSARYKYQRQVSKSHAMPAYHPMNLPAICVLGTKSPM